MRKTQHRQGISAAAWFYGQPGFHGHTIEIQATRAEVNAVVESLHRRSCGGRCQACLSQDAAAARLSEERAADAVTGVR